MFCIFSALAIYVNDAWPALWKGAFDPFDVPVMQVATLLIGGRMALAGTINAQQLTSYVMYVEFVTAASLSVCDQWGPFMEALGASERVIGYLDLPPAPQVARGLTLPDWSGKVRPPLPRPSYAAALASRAGSILTASGSVHHHIVVQ